MFEALQHISQHWHWGLYLVVALGPFLQEDAAIITAASSASLGLADPYGLYAALVVGLAASDLWKYWAGRWARTHHRAEWVAAHPQVIKVGKHVVDRQAVTLLIARFVPGTRVPIYLASGFFKAPFGKLAFWVVGSGMFYCLLMFLVFHYLGEVGGDRVRIIAPLVAFGVVFCFLIYQYFHLKFSSKAETPEPETPDGENP